jgi:putative glutamine amidotransferase
MHRPLIGLTAGFRKGTPQGGPLVAVRQKYVQSVLDAGGLPVVVPPATEDVLRGIFERLDGLLLTGGGDIDPVCFGERPHPKLGDVEPERDLPELTLCRWALAEDKPVFGICRGIQVMNVAAGGTLYQDIAAQYETTIVHAPDLSNPRAYLAHTLALDASTRLAGLLGQQPLPVNSWHHQAIKNLGRDLVVSARAPDGIVEGVEAPGHRFAVAVQFHPEDLYEVDERVRRLFAGFIAASGA